MTSMHVVNATRSTMLGSHVLLLDRWWMRLRGFLGRPAPAAGEGIILTPCTAVHMFGMRFPLDVVFLDERGVVVAVYAELAPGSRTRLEGRAAHALELPSGTVAASGTELGDRVSWSPSPQPPPQLPSSRWKFGRRSQVRREPTSIERDR